MSRVGWSKFVALIMVLLFAFGCSSEQGMPESVKKTVADGKKKVLAFGGGPTGGTFNFFANKMASIISVKYGHIDISSRGSGGSAENLRNLNKHGVDTGIVYAGDAFLGRKGLLPGDPTMYDNIRALAFLYGAPAQLVVRSDSGIDSVTDLAGKRVAVGNLGSGAALSAERFFKHLGLWDKIEHHNYGYSKAAADFIAGKIDGFWVLVGFPNSSIIEAASQVPIKLVNLHEVATQSAFYESYPFYSKVVIPAGTYDGFDEDVTTFQDAALWCASAGFDREIAYSCLTAVFSKQGLKDMVTAHKAAKDMALERGIESVSIPLHEGAYRFWRENGLEIPPNLKP